LSDILLVRVEDNKLGITSFLLTTSHMITPKEISANTLFYFDLNSCNIPQKPSIDIPIDIEVDIPRGQLSFSNTNSSRETSVLSNALSTVYMDCVQVLANNSTWTEQVEQEKIKEPALSYVTLKERETNSVHQTNATELILDPHRTVINNTCLSQGFETLAISYLINQLADSQL